MKAIIIEEKDCAALLDQLQLEAMKMEHDPRGQWSIPSAGEKAPVDSVHRAFHYIVVRWLQEQGASCVRY